TEKSGLDLYLEDFVPVCGKQLRAKSLLHLPRFMDSLGRRIDGRFAVFLIEAVDRFHQAALLGEIDARRGEQVSLKGGVGHEVIEDDARLAVALLFFEKGGCG